MITQEFFNNFISTYHPDYNNGVLRPLSWCHIPRESNDGYIEFIHRVRGNDISELFYAKYEDNKIKIKVMYSYLNIYIDPVYEIVEFYFLDMNNNTYDSFTINTETVYFLADQDILTFIKQFNNYILELNDKPILESEYNLYIKHLKNRPELIKYHESDNCIFRLAFYFEHSYIVIKVIYENKKNNKNEFFEYALFRNRIEGCNHWDIDNDVFFEVSQRIDEIYYDFQLFFLLI